MFRLALTALALLATSAHAQVLEAQTAIAAPAPASSALPALTTSWGPIATGSAESYAEDYATSASPSKVSIQRLTNAERLALGLPPNKPTKRFDATKTDKALQARASAGSTYAYWAVAYADAPTELLGYVAYTDGNIGITTLSAADSYKLPTTYPATQFTVATILSDGKKDTVLGVGNGVDGIVSEDSPAVYASFISSSGTDGGDPKSTLTEYGVETSIFDITAKDGTLAVTWTNLDGTTSAWNLYYWPAENTIFAAASAADVPVTDFSESSKIIITLIPQ